MMRTVQGLETSVSTFERGLWYDSDRKLYNPAGWGVKIAFLIGRFLRPIGKIYKIDYWRGMRAASKSKEGKDEFKKTYNSWYSGNHWFVIRLSWWLRLILSLGIGIGLYFILPLWITCLITFFLSGGFISIALGKIGLYLGTKPYDCSRMEYHKWMIDDEFLIGSTYLAPSVTIRTTRS